jgi:hypothetical protein
VVQFLVVTESDHLVVGPISRALLENAELVTSEGGQEIQDELLPRANLEFSSVPWELCEGFLKEVRWHESLLCWKNVPQSQIVLVIEEFKVLRWNKI